MDEREVLRRLILISKLTRRELQVLRLMPNHNDKEIGRGLGISGATTKNTQHHIREKFGIVGEGRLKTVLMGVELGLIDLGKVKFRRVRKTGEVWA